MKVYANEINTYDQLTLNAPNIYQCLGNFSYSEPLRPLGLAVTELLVLSLIFLAVVRRIELTTSRIVLAAAVIRCIGESGTGQARPPARPADPATTLAAPGDESTEV